MCALASCHKEAPPEPEPEATPTPSETPTPPPVAIATPSPTPNHLAPPGVYFLMVPVSVVTDDGVTGLRPGTRVTQRADGKFQAEGITVELQGDQITNDLWVAARIAGADQAAQATIRKMAQITPVPIPNNSSLPPPENRPALVQDVPPAAPDPTENPLSAPAKRVNPGSLHTGRIR